MCLLLQAGTEVGFQLVLQCEPSCVQLPPRVVRRHPCILAVQAHQLDHQPGEGCRAASEIGRERAKVASPSSFSASTSRSTSSSSFAGVVESPGPRGWPPQERRSQLLGKGPLSFILVVRHAGGDWPVGVLFPDDRISVRSEGREPNVL